METGRSVDSATRVCFHDVDRDKLTGAVHSDLGPVHRDLRPVHSDLGRSAYSPVRPRGSPMEQTSDHIRACYDAVAREYAERFVGELARPRSTREEGSARLAHTVNEERLLTLSVFALEGKPCCPSVMS